MAPPNYHHGRKLILQPSTNITTQYSICMFDCDPNLNHTGVCLPECILFCPTLCATTGPSSSPANSPPYEQPPPPENPSHHHPLLSLPLKLSVIFITATLFYALYKLFRRWRRRTPPSPSPENQENHDHDLNDVVDHPIWYIRTTGLQPSVINGIKVVKFDKNDKMIDGSDCLVCLSEFEENDMARLLPICKHVFHISCIDTWLRSHTNCPLCRAEIVTNDVVSTHVMMEVELRDYNEAGESSELRVDEDEISNYSIDDDGDLGIELVKIKLPINK
uniref:RING-H2 finger protein ATL54-like n=1 Tax=Erigeron canadensis TaxID=72917 RepID=UPI001CB97C8C|nr:RING-H2 finger protein ATL54-like [Erigeron canadensis]